MLKLQLGSWYGSFSFGERSKPMKLPYDWGNNPPFTSYFKVPSGSVSCHQLRSQVHPYTFRPYFEKNYKAMEDPARLSTTDG